MRTSTPIEDRPPLGVCGQWPSNRRNSAPVRQTFAYTGRGNQEGTHAPLEGAPRLQVRVPTPGLYAMSRGVVPCPNGTPTALPDWQGLRSVPVMGYQDVPRPHQAAACRAAATPCLGGRSL